MCGPARSRCRQIRRSCVLHCCTRSGRGTPRRTACRRSHRNDAYAALRTAYRRGVVDLAVKDLCAPPTPRTSCRPLAGNSPTLQAPPSKLPSPSRVPRQPGQFGAADVADVGLAVIGMGKCGARELNYISDVDVIYVVDAGGLDDARASTIGTALARESPGPSHRWPGNPGSGRWTRTSGLRASQGRWSAPSPPTRRTTRAGPRAGSSRHC
jgi:glutamine synthetase adenylyltransferase